MSAIFTTRYRNPWGEFSRIWSVTLLFFSWLVQEPTKGANYEGQYQCQDKNILTQTLWQPVWPGWLAKPPLYGEPQVQQGTVKIKTVDVMMGLYR